MKKFIDILITLVGKILLPLFLFSSLTSFVAFFALPLMDLDHGEKLLIIVQTARNRSCLFYERIAGFVLERHGDFYERKNDNTRQKTLGYQGTV